MSSSNRMPMSRQQKLIVAGIAVILAAVLVLQFRSPGPEPGVEPAAVESRSAEKVEPAKPAGVDLDPEAARELAARRIEIVPLDRDPAALQAESGPGYATVEAAFEGDADPSPFFLAFHDRDVGAIVLSATLSLGDGRDLPTIPVLVLARRRGADGFETVFAIGRRQAGETPPFRLDGAITLRLALEASYVAAGDAGFADAIAASARRVVAAFARRRTLWTAGAEAADRVRDFNRLLAEHRSKRLPDLIVLEVDPYRAPRPRSYKVVIKDASGVFLGEVSLRIAARPLLASVLEVADARRVMGLKVGATRTLGDHFADNPGPLARFLGATPQQLGAACRGLRDELTDRLGLSAFDASDILRALATAHALFATGADYRTDCPEAGLEALAAALPAAFSGDLNAALGRVGAGLRAGDGLAALFADSVALYDFSGIWLGGGNGNIVRTGDAVVHPAAGPDQAAGYLADLPIVHFACFSAGSGLLGAHRAALVELEHDPALWVLDVAFDRDMRIAGVSLSEADRKQVCRAVGNRKSGPGACFFATTGRDYRGVDPAGC